MLQIDYKSGISICDQIVNGFIRLIAVGVLKTDDAMPSVRSLALKLSVNPNTIQKAYTLLEERGVIYSVKGKGSFVANGDNTKVAIFDNEKEKLKQALLSSKSVGFPRAEIIKLLDEVYKEEGVGTDD